MLISRCFEVIGAVFRGEAVEDDADASPERVDGTGWLGSERGLELGEGHLDRVHVRGVWRQVEQLRLFLGDDLGDAIDLVGPRVVHDDDVARSERWREDLGGVGLERGPVHRPFQNPGSDEATSSQTGDEGHGLPMSEGRAGQQTLADRAASMKPRHLGVHSAFIQEHQAPGIDPALGRPPGAPPRRHVRAVLFGGAQGFF